MASDVKSAALRYLKIRPRSVFELQQKLKLKGFDLKEIDEVLKHLLNVKLLNDRVFADAWIRYRLARPFGFGRIIRELQEKGVPSEIIDQAVSKARDQYAESDVVLELALRKAARLRGIDKEKRKKRIVDFLIRRGFKVDEALKAIRKLGNQTC